MTSISYCRKHFWDPDEQFQVFIFCTKNQCKLSLAFFDFILCEEYMNIAKTRNQLNSVLSLLNIWFILVLLSHERNYLNERATCATPLYDMIKGVAFHEFSRIMTKVKHP